MLPVASVAACSSWINEAARSQVTGEQHHDRTRIKGQRKLAERADATGKPDVPLGMHIPAMVIPYEPGGNAGQPMPAKFLVDRHADAEDVQRPPQYRQSGRISPVEVRGEAIEKKIGCARSLRRCRSGHGGARYFHHIRAEGHATGEHSRRQGLQVGRPGKVDVDWLEPAAAFSSRDGASLPRFVTNASSALSGRCGLAESRSAAQPPR